MVRLALGNQCNDCGCGRDFHCECFVSAPCSRARGRSDVAGHRTREARSGNSASAGTTCLLRKLPTHSHEGDSGKWLSYSATGTANPVEELIICGQFCYRWC